MIKILRGLETTDYVANTDDARILRYATAGYNGVTKDFLNECGYEETGNVFKVKSGEIIHDGWQAEIDANGASVTLLNSATKYFYTVYCKFDFSVIGEYTATIGAIYSASDYPAVPASDDLTENAQGIAYEGLYHVTIQNGIIDSRTAIFNLLELGDSKHAETADDATDATNATNGVRNTDDTYQRLFKATSSNDDALNLGTNIIEQKRLIYNGSVTTTNADSNSPNIVVTVPSVNLVTGKKYRIEGSFNGGGIYSQQIFTIEHIYNNTHSANCTIPFMATSNHDGNFGAINNFLVSNSGSDLIIAAYCQEINGTTRAKYLAGAGMTINKIYLIIE